MPYTTEQIRSLLLRSLKLAKNGNRRLQLEVGSCIHGVRGILEPAGGRPSEELDESDERKIIHVIWDLIFDRILIPGSDEPRSSSGWPFLTLTDHGLKVLEESRAIPYDPDGYLAALKKSVPGLHDTAYRYVEEAIATFRARCFLASAVTLGAASERILVDLTESIGKVIADPGKQKRFQEKGLRGKMRDRLNAVTGWCRNNRSQLRGEWAGEERVEVIDRLAHFIRSRRNDTGHPQDPPAVPTNEETYASLVVFPDYCRWIYDLKTDLDSRVGAIL